jgi:hypothetical protein
LSITFPDEQPGDTLASRREAIDFTSDREITEVRAVYDEELVYTQAGGFEPQYSLSTKNDDATSFAVKRNGGWQRTMALYPEETPVPPTPIPADGQTWGGIYDVDMTAQAAQTLTTAGSYTIDGKTWWAKGTLPSGASSAVVATTGLRLATGTTGNFPDWRSNNAFGNRVYAMPLAQLDEYNPLAPLAVIARITSPNGWTANGQLNAYVGIGNVALTTAAVTAAEKAATTTVSMYNVTSMWFVRDAQANITDNISPSGAGLTNIGQVVQGVVRFATSRVYPLIGKYSLNPDLGDPNSLNIYTAFPVAGTADGGTSNASVLFFLNQGLDGTPQDYALTHLKIMQPKVAP